MDTTNNRPVGPMIGLIVILLIIIGGGIYFWQSRIHTTPDNSSAPAQNQQTPNDVDQIESQSSSDEPDQINSDLNAYGETEINSVDSDL